jgi:hypothetical protein
VAVPIGCVCWCRYRIRRRNRSMITTIPAVGMTTYPASAYPATVNLQTQVGYKHQSRFAGPAPCSPSCSPSCSWWIQMCCIVV